jgi:hypothetical protein
MNPSLALGNQPTVAVAVLKAKLSTKCYEGDSSMVSALHCGWWKTKRVDAVDLSVVCIFLAMQQHKIRSSVGRRKLLGKQPQS